MAAPGKMTGFPNGVTSFGAPVVPAQWGGGNKVLWVDSNGVAGDGSSLQYPLTSVFGTTGALAKLNSTRGAIVMVAAGHAETIAAATTVSGVTSAKDVNIVGLGYGLNRPTFNFTAAASKLTVDVKGTWFRNCVFHLCKTAATVVTAAIEITETDGGFDTCYFIPAVSATQLATTAINVKTGGDRTSFLTCTIVSPTSATNPTDILKVANAVDQFTAIGCDVQSATNATGNGVLNIAAAATNVYVEDCLFVNYKAASTVAVIGTASATGQFRYVGLQIQAATGAATAFNTPGNMVLEQVMCSVPGKAAIAVGTTSG